jgi:hypothetical protein
MENKSMPKAMQATTTDRRRLLAGLAALGGIPSAAVMPSAALAGPLAPPPPLSPDAELIALCGHHAGLIAAFNACEADSGPENPEWVAYEASMDAISDAKPLTLTGVQAKALAAKAEALNPDGSEHPDGSIAAHWAWDIVNDMLRLTGGAA